MRQATCIAILSLSSATGVGAQTATFASLAGRTGLSVQRFDIDPSHSAVEFTVRFMGLSTVRGAFAEFGGTVMYDSARVENSSIAVAIRAASVNTNSVTRDRHLRSPDFLDAEKFPLITFRSTTVSRTPGGLFLTGPLTLHGVTRDVAIAVRQLHPLRGDAWGNKRIGFAGSVTLNRKDFGVQGTAFWNSEFDPGRMAVADSIRVELTVSAQVSNTDRWTLPKGDSVLKVIAAQGLAPTLQQLRAASADTTKEPGKIALPILATVGTKMMHRLQFADAVEVFKLASELAPSNPLAHASLGEAYLMAGRRDRALRSLERAAELDPANTVASEYLRRLR